MRRVHTKYIEVEVSYTFSASKSHRAPWTKNGWRQKNWVCANLFFEALEAFQKAATLAFKPVRAGLQEARDVVWKPKPYIMKNLTSRLFGGKR